jgi:hypothetical protein
MKKILTLLALFSLLITVTAFSPVKTTHRSGTEKTAAVYICNSPTAYVYHSTENCRGLQNCTHQILQVSLSDAIDKYRRRACKLCE